MNPQAGRRAQLQSLEPIIIVIFLALIIGIMLVFYLRISSAESTRDAGIQDNIRELELLKRMSNLPEISCPSSETGQTYCIDLYKARAFGQEMEDQRKAVDYYPFFGSVRITLNVTDPEFGHQEDIVLYDNIPDDAYVRPSITYVSVYDPRDDTRRFGMITMERAS